MTEETRQKLREVGLNVLSVILPKDGTEMTKWAVVACDQFTSEPEYWVSVDQLVGEAPSTLRLVYPEVFLENSDKRERILAINQKMEQYLGEGTLEEKFEGMVAVKRWTAKGQIRKGLVVSLDLERYDYKKGAKSLIRATEGTVESRIPPRLEIRENAQVELPHIMVLIDDPEHDVIDPVWNKDWEKIYGFDLMMNGGKIEGYRIDEEAEWARIAQELGKLTTEDGFLYAMGDGNHSMATAKAHWERVKVTLSEEEKVTHPARFAMVELVNIHDSALEFEPIHRVLFGVDEVDLEKYLSGEGAEMEVISSGIKKTIRLREMWSQLTVGNLQIMLDEYLATHEGVKIDYVHGVLAVEKLASSVGNVGFLLPTLKKEELFPAVEKDGALPRKTFSMGEPQEKRFYLEARKIR
ncbi:MAG: DUF1015 domain-containing protein [Candidatus Shapirobacteria bacterium]